MIDIIAIVRQNFSEAKWTDFYLPRRFILVFLGFLGVTNIFAMRVSISMAMVAMVNQTAIKPLNSSMNQPSECPDLDNYQPPKRNDGFKGEQFFWDAKTQGAILGAYYYGYIVTQLPGGILAEKFGAKWVFGGGVFGTAIICLITPFVANCGALAFAALRVLQGLAEGVTIPAINFAISTWSPKIERSRFSTVIYLGAPVGTVISMPISGLLCSTDLLGGWPSAFYFFGALSCIWFGFWCFFIYESPAVHPSISKEELYYIEYENDAQSKKKSAALWKNIFTSVPTWAVVIAQTGDSFGLIIFLMQLPTYLNTVLHYEMESNGFLSALPFTLQAIGSFVISFAADGLRSSEKMSVTRIRKIFNSIGSFVPAICLIGVTFAGCRPGLIVALISLAMLINGCVYSGYHVTHVDMSPELSGTLYGIANAVGHISGILGPMCVGAFTENGATLSNWNKVFYLTAFVYVFCGIVFAVFGSAELQPWGTSTEEPKEPKYTEKRISIYVITKKYSRRLSICDVIS